MYPKQTSSNFLQPTIKKENRNEHCFPSINILFPSYNQQSRTKIEMKIVSFLSISFPLLLNFPL